MSNPTEQITADVLRAWGLPDPGTSKKSRGRVIVVGGSRRTPGAVVLAAEAALRVGAGRLGVIVPKSVDAQLGAVIPEAAVFALPDESSDPFSDAVRDEIASADAVLVGPGFDDPDETRATLTRVAECEPPTLVLDAYALVGAIAGMAARGLDPAAAAVWGAWLHARAGDRLTSSMGLGFLARDIAAEVPFALHETLTPHTSA